MIRRESASELITILNQVDEQEDIEAKAISGNDVGKSTLESICALSNEPGLGGGTILLGVSREQSSLFPLYTADGVLDADKLSSDLQSSCSTMFNTPIRVDIRAELVGEAVVLRVDVPELPKSYKPAYFAATGLPKGAWRRVGPTDVRCTDEDLTAFWVGQSHEAYDTRLVKDAHLSDIDLDALSQYRAARAESSPNDEHLTWPDEELLYALGAVRKVEERWRVTFAGLLMFGKSSSIRRCLPTIRVDYIRISGNQWVPDATSTYESLDMRGPIIRIIPRVISAILDDLPKTFDVGAGLSGQRSETPVIPFRAIREAVVNSLMHRSYEAHSPVQILRFANRLEIRNPGYSLKSQDRFEEAGSEIRNPTIAAMLHETRFAETKGSGIRIMQRTMVEHGLASPTFKSDRDRSEFSVAFLFHHFLNPDDWSWLQSFSEFNLSEEQMKALIFVREVGTIDNARYRSLNGVDTLTASKALRDLRTQDLLTARGSGNSAFYVAGPQMIAREAIGGYIANPQDNALTLEVPPQGSGPKFEDLPASIRMQTRSASMMPRMSESYARKVIYGLCQWRALSGSDIAAWLSKNKVYVQQQYIAPMVADGSLSYFIPDVPSHPDQKYVAGERLLEKPG